MARATLLEVHRGEHTEGTLPTFKPTATDEAVTLADHPSSTETD
jgi:hypothetical protein